MPSYTILLDNKEIEVGDIFDTLDEAMMLAEETQKEITILKNGKPYSKVSPPQYEECDDGTMYSVHDVDSINMEL